MPSALVTGVRIAAGAGFGSKSRADAAAVPAPAVQFQHCVVGIWKKCFGAAGAKHSHPMTRDRQEDAELDLCTISRTLSERAAACDRVVADVQWAPWLEPLDRWR